MFHSCSWAVNLLFRYSSWNWVYCKCQRTTTQSSYSTSLGIFQILKCNLLQWSFSNTNVNSSSQQLLAVTEGESKDLYEGEDRRAHISSQLLIAFAKRKWGWVMQLHFVYSIIMISEDFLGQCRTPRKRIRFSKSNYSVGFGLRKTSFTF